jgi:dipeptidyl aminopeptidase/acylaminoacyl peptidase
MPLDSLKPQRLWRSEASGYESVVDVMADGASFITSFESPSDYPNYFSRTLNLAAANASPESAAGARAAITSFADPVPQVRDVKKELIKYTRSDGVELSGTLYLPPGYDKAKDGPLPLFLWAYPLEFTDKSTAGQVSSTPTTFTRMGGISHLCLVFAGYAVLDDATMPVIGDPETVNDTFVQQIVSSAQAAIDKCVELGVADRDRVAVGGHSYGAFMTANLLAHSELFRAGVARSGAYNRTLTPFGFQGERRTFWEAGDTYTKMSPFTYADKIKTPLLMIHGQIDNNPGTFPMQSERLFAAIKGLGGTAKLVMLPFESHGYSAMESALHVQAETVEWLDRYVKPAKQPSEGKATERTGQ